LTPKRIPVRQDRGKKKRKKSPQIAWTRITLGGERRKGTEERAKQQRRRREFKRVNENPHPLGEKDFQSHEG